MSAAAPSTPAVGSATTVPSASPTHPPARSGPIRDRGVVRRDAIRATGWTSDGVAKVLGDVDVVQGSSAGLVSIAGRLLAGTFRARGTLEVLGPVNVREELRVDGTIHFFAAVRAGAMVSAGTLRCGGDLGVDRAFVGTGSVEMPSVHTGAFEFTGAAAVPGDLEAMGRVRIGFRGDSRIGSIRAKRVELHGPPTSPIPTLWRSVFGGSAAVHVDRIEAESVALSAVDVGFVHAREIDLGPGAHVTALEGTIVRQHPTSRVGPESRTPKPHGLTR
jgi:cytoskeletal protein CcmA (bactofilin family)